jgi:hypothetical protein
MEIAKLVITFAGAIAQGRGFTPHGRHAQGETVVIDAVPAEFRKWIKVGI